MFCNRKGEDDIMTRLKNGNKQESRAAPKWKRWLPMGIAFLLIIAFCGILFYNVALAAEKTYNPNGYCYIKVGDANLPVHVYYTGTKTELTESGDHKTLFTSKSRPVKVISDITNPSPNGSVVTDLKISDAGTKNTVKDSDGYYNTILFHISFKLKAHYYLNGQNKSKNSKGQTPYGKISFVSGTGVTVPKGQKEAPYDVSYNFSKYAGHNTSDRTITIPVRLNLINTSMLKGKVKGLTDVLAWFHTTLSTSVKRNQYTLTCNPDSGTFTKTKGGSKNGNNLEFKKYCGESVTSLPEVSRSGYHFNGWYNSSKKAVTSVTLCNGDQTVTASWSKEYTLKFDANGGPSTPAARTLITGKEYGTLDNLTRKGYKFDGWYTAKTGGTKASSTNKITADTTLYAHWTAYKHNFVYNLQGGSFPSSLKNQTSLNGCKIIPNGVYYMKSDCGTNMYMHVYGRDYEPRSNPATVIYSGKNDAATQTQWLFERYKNTQYYYIISVHNGLALNLDGDPNVDQSNKAINLWNQQNDKADYVWYLSDEGNGKVSIYNKQTNKCLDVINGRAEDNTWIEQYTPNHTVAQLWTLEEKTKTDYPDRMQYGDHGLYINSVSPEKNNYEFTCWNTKPDGTGTSYTPGQAYSAIKDGGTVTLYALYNVDDFTLSFDANGGTGKLNSVTHKGNQSYALPVNTFTRIGYEFRGWSFDKYTDTISYKNGATYDNRLISATLYAQWKKTGTGFIQRPFLDSDMFYKAISILGNNGTVYNKNSVDSRMAHIDTANNPGYFSLLK